MKSNSTVIIRDEAMRTRVAQHIANLSIEKPWAVTVEPYKKRRSLSQNALMWLWLEEVVKHVYESTGQDKEDIHEFFKRQFLTPTVKDVFGVEVKTWSTKELTTAGMSTYMAAIDVWVASELGLLLPTPADLDTRWRAA